MALAAALISTLSAKLKELSYVQLCSTEEGENQQFLGELP